MTKFFNKLRLLKLSQRGDTLIEVTIATIIIGIILSSAYVLGNKAFQLGQLSKERSQAAQIMQSQAEGLRSLRDFGPDWATFQALFTTGELSSGFHLSKSSGQWQVVSGGNWDPSSDDSELPPGLYSLTITGQLTGASNPCDPAVLDSCDTLEATITINWPSFGSGPTQTSSLYTHLTDVKIFK